MEGKVKKFWSQRGFGFITGNDGIDVFVHYSAINDIASFKSLDLGEAVTYDVVHDERGPKALNVTKI